MNRKHSELVRTAVRSAVRAVAVAFGLCLVGIAAADEPATWQAPNIDNYFYKHFTSGGDSSYGPTWGHLEVDQNTGQFIPPDQMVGATRHSQLLLGFNTATHIRTGLPASLYDVYSVTVTLKLYDVGGTQPIRYWDSPVNFAQIHSKLESGSTAWPIEMYGVGMRAGYDHFEFGTNVFGPPGLEEKAVAYPFFTNWYVAYPIVDDPTNPGTYRDTSNNIAGGFSATAPGNVTAPFEVTPWAIGKTTLTPNAADPPIVPLDSTFTFTLDLNLPGVRSYVQQSLATGGLGLFVSSLHQSELGGVSGSYPKWFTKEAQFAGAAPATLSIDYQITGDYDRNGLIEPADYTLWRESFGNGVAAGMAADGNGNGLIDAADYVVWRKAISSLGGGAGTEGGAISSNVVPEPASWAIGTPLGMVLFSTRRARRGRRGTIAIADRSAVVHSANGPRRLYACGAAGRHCDHRHPRGDSAAGDSSGAQAGRRMSCQNNLRQIGIATLNYNDQFKHLPPPKVGSSQFTFHGSTLMLLLPYVEESSRYAQIDVTKPSNESVNLPMTGKPLALYLCPSMSLPREVPDLNCDEVLGPGSYIISTRTEHKKHPALDGAFANPKPDGSYSLGLQHITDGASKTLLVGEINYGLQAMTWTNCASNIGQTRWGDQTWAHGYWAFAWGHMSGELPELYNNSQKFDPSLSLRSFRSDHAGGVQFVLLDGSVHMLATDSDPNVRRALVTRPAGRRIPVSTKEIQQYGRAKQAP